MPTSHGSQPGFYMINLRSSLVWSSEQLSIPVPACTVDDEFCALDGVNMVVAKNTCLQHDQEVDFLLGQDLF